MNKTPFYLNVCMIVENDEQNLNNNTLPKLQNEIKTYLAMICSPKKRVPIKKKNNNNH